jgi:hypothetical protein
MSLLNTIYIRLTQYMPKRQYHKIFDLFFHQSTAPRLLINTRKYFWILFQFCRDICQNVLTQPNVEYPESWLWVMLNSREFFNICWKKTPFYAILCGVTSLRYVAWCRVMTPLQPKLNWDNAQYCTAYFKLDGYELCFYLIFVRDSSSLNFMQQT